MSNKELNIIDKYEFYSFSIYLYGYAFFYLFIFEQNLLKGLFINFFINIILTYSINHNIILFIIHKYWKNNLNDIALPQLISCMSNVITKQYNLYLMITLNTIVFYFIKRIYTKEIMYSKNLRIISFLFFVLMKFIL